MKNQPVRLALLLCLSVGIVQSTIATTSDAAASDASGDGAQTPSHGAFPDADLKRWKERSFEGNSTYALVEDDGLQVLKGETRGQASVLYREVPIDLKKTPWLQWSWKIASTYGSDIDERSKAGDDFPARLYVVVKTGLFPWQTLAINYVWSSSSEAGAIWKNPFTDKAGMIAVRTGDREAGQWVTQKRDVMADFRTVFGKEIDALDGYAVMVDGDNSGANGTSWFGNIDFTAE